MVKILNSQNNFLILSVAVFVLSDGIPKSVIKFSQRKTRDGKGLIDRFFYFRNGDGLAVDSLVEP
ncbi:MAG: hypothetical protein COX17_00795 [Deltaproteobacteria bacterium CG23_combo_of_CG06-09_8_20_14_all_60_8]|nr:MAG: hypothetical protein COX17_00795 [Deltaproteobacteria bacterium CG23_combo_of_CG06-09_8_20_14_all_60_8]